MIEPIYQPEPSRYDSGMEYRRCGRSGILLPDLSLGFWHNFGETAPLERSKEIMRFAFDRGITSFDLANNYGPGYGTAEETFGYVFDKSFRAYRDEMFVASKAGYDMWPGPYGNWGSRKYLFASLHQSLQRMKLEYVDIFYSHRFDPDTPMEETLHALVDIVRQGKALYIGISKWPYNATQFAYNYLAERDVPCLIYQGRYNMIDRGVEKSGILQQASENGVGFTAFSPLEQGILTGRYLNGIPDGSRASKGKFLKPEVITPQLVEKLRALNVIAEGRGQTLAEMSLAWLLKDNMVTSVIVGSSSVNQLADSIRCLDNLNFTQEELNEIDRILFGD